MNKFKNKKNKKTNEINEIIKNIEQTKRELDYSQLCLEFATEHLLIDSLIYEVKSLQKKYDYYLKICKEKGISIDKFKSVGGSRKKPAS